MGLFVVKRYFEEFKEGIGSFFWPSVKETIDDSISYNIRKVKDESYPTGKYYSSDIFYKYFIDGKEFTSRRIRVGQESVESMFKWRLNRTINKYRRRGDVKIFYNPSDPQKAVLKRGLTFGYIFLFGYGTLMLILSLFPLLWALFVTIGSNQ
jgi:hypothetical protein